jgi:hypothetical protein
MYINYEGDNFSYKIVPGDKVSPDTGRIILWCLCITFMTGFVVYLSIKQVNREKEEREVYATLRVLKEEFNIEIGEQEKLDMMQTKIDAKVIKDVSDNKKMSTNMAWARPTDTEDG